MCLWRDPPLNNQLSALSTLHVTPTTGDTISRRQSLHVGGPPRGITLSRQNSISSQTTTDKSTQKATVTRRPSGCLSPAAQTTNDVRAVSDRISTTTIGDQSDVAAEIVVKNLEASHQQIRGGRDVPSVGDYKKL